MLPNPSFEQLDIIKNIKSNNVRVDSISGAGKTSTSLLLAVNHPHDNILLLTYNSRLKTETREKVEHNNIKNMTVHSYHSFNTNNYNKENYTDIGIKKTIDQNISLINPVKYNIIILDESQDITKIYYEFICKIYRDTCTHNTRLCILGDKNQSIFDFNGADNRFLINAKILLNFNNLSWIDTKLSISYRITNQMANFVNHNMLGYSRLTATKDNKLVNYIILDIFNNYQYIYDKISYILSLGYSYRDIFILAPSVKSEKQPIKLIANYLSLIKKIPIYVPVSDDEVLDTDLLNNKLVITTFHQVKGLERKVVFVTNFDASYFSYYKKNVPETKCPNELYVACTRASEILIIIHNEKNLSIPFLNIDDLTKYVNIYYHNIRLNNIIFQDTKIYVPGLNNKCMNSANINCQDYLNKNQSSIFDHIPDYPKHLMFLRYIYHSKIDQDTHDFSSIILILENIDSKLVLLTKDDSGDYIKIKRLEKLITKKNISYTNNLLDLTNLEPEIIICYSFSGKSSLSPVDTYTVNYNNNLHSFKISLNINLDYQDLIKIINILQKYIQTNNTDISKKELIQNTMIYTVTDLCKFLPTNILSDVIEQIDYNLIEQPNDIIKIKCKTKQENLYENVGIITGIAIPSLFELISCKRIKLIDCLNNFILEVLINIFNNISDENDITDNLQDILFNIITSNHMNYDLIKEVIDIIEKNNTSIIDHLTLVILQLISKIIIILQDFTYNTDNIVDMIISDNNPKIKMRYIKNLLIISNFYNCIKNGYYHTMTQIQHYNWLSVNTVNKLINRLNTRISNNCQFEYSLIVADKLSYIKSTDNELQTVGIRGIIDCYDKSYNKIWEFKCASALDNSYFIQLALYAYLFYRYHNNDKDSCKGEPNQIISDGDKILYLSGSTVRETYIKKVIKTNHSYKIIKNKKRLIIKHENILKNLTKDCLINYKKIDFKNPEYII